jgi:tRNA/tmRNA/rRNA uracil-C5-methylase (TrmA/RlmC/RlmD family)
LTLGGVAHGGWCVARLDGLAVFVSGALPGETVLAEVTERRSKLWFARTAEVLEPSPDRVPHVWPLAAATGIGGADLGHVALAAQRRWKAEVVAQQLRRIAHLEQAVAVEAAPGDDGRGGLAWRTRAAFTANAAGRLAMAVPGTRDLVAVDSMPLLHEDLQVAAPWEREWAPGTRVTAVRPSGGPPFITDKHAGAAVTEKLAWAGEEFSYQVDSAGFWQAHREAPALLAAAVMPAADVRPGEAVVDLYAGAGLFSLPLAAAAGVTGRLAAVEGDLRAAARLAQNLRPYNWAAAIHADVKAVFARRRALPQRPAAVVLDPPRQGAGEKVAAAIAGLGPGRVVYVACDPAALARDVACFERLGYTLAALRAFDLFPHTHHVECVATLEPNRETNR